MSTTVFEFLSRQAASTEAVPYCAMEEPLGGRLNCPELLVPADDLDGPPGHLLVDTEVANDIEEVAGSEGAGN